MFLRSYVVDNGGVDWYLNYYSCNRCQKEIHESWPHYSDKSQNVQFCWECTFIEGYVTEAKYLRQTGFGWMPDAHASVVDGQVISWVGKTAPWERKTSDYRRTKQYRVWRESVLMRDGYACRHCGSIEKLQAHHLKSFAKYEKHRFKRSNGLTLCEKCHKAEHKRMKQGDSNVRRVSNK